MSQLTQALKSLLIIDEDLQKHSRRKEELKRQAWMTSGKTIGRARQLVAEATLSILKQGRSVEIEVLELEIAKLALGGDRFALDLCQDWLDSAGEVACPSLRDEAGRDGAPPN